MKSTGALILTILGVIVSVVVAWWFVTMLLSIVWWIVKVLIITVVAVFVFVTLRRLLSKGDAKQR